MRVVNSTNTEPELISVEEILTWKSIDGATPDKTKFEYDERHWDYHLKEMRSDRQYNDVLESIRTRGFTQPLTAIFDNHGTPKFGDGHHRLAAAMELGITDVPILWYSDNHWYKAIADDSGNWYEDSYMVEGVAF